jgi:hypothetical protein
MDETTPSSHSPTFSHTLSLPLPLALPLPRSRSPPTPFPPPCPARSQPRPSGGRGAGCTRVKWKRGLAAAAGQEQRASRWPQRDRKASGVRAGSGVETVSHPTVATRRPSGVTRAASLAEQDRPAFTVTRGVRLPWWRRQCASKAPPRRGGGAEPRGHRHPAPIGIRRSSARSTATDMGKR